MTYLVTKWEVLIIQNLTRTVTRLKQCSKINTLQCITLQRRSQPSECFQIRCWPTVGGECLFLATIFGKNSQRVSVATAAEQVAETVDTKNSLRTGVRDL